MRTFRAGHAWNDAGNVEFDDLRVVDVSVLRNSPQPLGAVIRFHDFALFRTAASAAEVIDGGLINSEESHSGAVFRGHVSQSGAVGHAEGLCSWAEKLDEFAYHFGFAEQFGDAQHQIGGGDTWLQGARQVDADDFRHEESHGLPQHAGFGFNAADAPADNAQTIDHGGVRISADQRVWVENTVFFQHAFGEVFQVHLVDDADAGRHDFERIEGLFAPLQKLVAFAVAVKFEVEIAAEGVAGTGEIHLDRVVHD